jgi:hypothetical protein
MQNMRYSSGIIFFDSKSQEYSHVIIKNSKENIYIYRLGTSKKVRDL